MLLVAEIPAALQGAEVKEGKTDRFFQLVGELAGQKNIGNMGLEVGYLLYRMGIGRRLFKGRDYLSVIHLNLTASLWGLLRAAFALKEYLLTRLSQA